MVEEGCKTGRVENGNIVRSSFGLPLSKAAPAAGSCGFTRKLPALQVRLRAEKRFLASSGSSVRKFISRLFWEEFTTAHLQSSFFSCLHFPEFSLAASPQKCLSGSPSPRGYVCRWTESCFRPGSENSGGCLYILSCLFVISDWSCIEFCSIFCRRIKNKPFLVIFFPLLRVLTRVSRR